MVAENLADMGRDMVVNTVCARQLHQYLVDIVMKWAVILHGA